MKRGTSFECRGMSRSCTYVGGNSTEDECIGLYGIFERKKQRHHIPKMGKHEISISKQIVLVQRILCRYNGKKYKKINEYINNQIKEDRMAEQLTMEFNDPFKGRQAKISKSQADRGLGGLSERMSPMGDERKTTS